MFEDVGGWGEFSGPSDSGGSAFTAAADSGGGGSFWDGWSMPSMPSGSDLLGGLKGVTDVWTSITNTKTNASIAKAQNDYMVNAKKAGLEMDRAVLQGQVNRARQQADASYQAGQGPFGNSFIGGGGLSPMLMLLLAAGAFLIFKK